MADQQETSAHAVASPQHDKTDWPFVSRKKAGHRSVMDFPREVATSNRRHRLDRIRRRIFTGSLVSSTSVTCDVTTTATLPLDRSYVESLKESYPERSYYGGPTQECPYCGAVFWFQERVKSASAVSRRKIVYNLCYIALSLMNMLDEHNQLVKAFRCARERIEQEGGKEEIWP
ncbi:uncharacterized protein LOC112890603 [Panicum hallii]|uniref:uncharacterized protein LOC112890603 n=1 Tax=Panicum hallii TaxID=206008 RepID=UPI000DF4DCBE|nr:uncharacterized protein LOC112890603 [Panicum hallii]